MEANELKEKLDLIEFRQELLFNNSSFDRLLFEHNVTRQQYRTIMDLMDELRAQVDNGEKINHGSYENRIYRIVPESDGNYHFAENIAQSLHEGDRWTEVFEGLYGDMPKFQSYMNKHE